MLPHLLFDFGGVILNIDFNRTIAAMRSLSRAGSTIEFTQAQQSQLFDDLETGHLTPADFRAGLRQHYELDAPDDVLDEAWSAMLLDVPVERLALIGELRKQGHQTALLSNTNVLHIDTVNRRLAQDYGFKNGIGDVLDRVFYSQEVGFRKPGEDIFNHALREMNWRAEDTLFIEDSPQHIVTARRLGLQVLYLKPPLTLTTTLPEAIRAFPAEYAPTPAA